MKLLILCGGLALTFAFFTSSCGQLSTADRITLSKRALSFNHEGADLSECGLVSQFENGRSLSSQNAGGG